MLGEYTFSCMLSANLFRNFPYWICSNVVLGYTFSCMLSAIFTALSASSPRADVAYRIHGLTKRLAKTHNWTACSWSSCWHQLLTILCKALRDYARWLKLTAEWQYISDTLIPILRIKGRLKRWKEWLMDLCVTRNIPFGQWG
jgi:hypothetical protein